MKIDFPRNEDISKLQVLWQEAFGDTKEFIDLFFTNGFSSDRARCIITEGRAIAALYWFECEAHGEKIAYIYAVATTKSHRGKGLCRILMEDTHRHLKESGFKSAILVPASSSLFGFYEKMGYKTCSYVTEFECTASDESTPLTKLCMEDFLRIRRSFLAAGDVIQEKENINFLSSYTDFYSGESFVIAVRKENNTLICSEILGDLSKAPHIVNSLGCEKGVFRTKGNEKPFAMLYPLTEEAFPSPSYFGFAFD